MAAVSDYYTFLAQMYMKESSVMYPPPVGWPQIVNADPAALRSLGKSDRALLPMAHLPYICLQDEAQPIPSCTFAEWPDRIHSRCTNGSNPETRYIVTEGADFMKLAPPHVFGLASGSYADSPRHKARPHSLGALPTRIPVG